MERVAAEHAPQGRSAGRTGDAISRPVRDGLPGRPVETPHGEVLVVRRTYPQSTLHGREPVAGYLEIGPGLAALGRDPRLAALPATGALFLDTETTGLAGGTGTFPFLVGCGSVDEQGRFVLLQLMCREPAEEPAMLELLAERLAEAAYLVTFNGRSFDIPLVNTRFVLNRMRNPGHGMPHLDLLHVARRIYGRRLSDRSLGSLESAVLGFAREGDIPGHRIPAAYADFLRGGPTEPMVAVLEHNALDLLALAALGAVLERIYLDPDAVEHAADHLGLATAALAAGQSDAADRHLSQAWGAAGGDERRIALHMAARQAARHKQYRRARDLWQAILETEPEDAQAHLALAKHFEHREKDLDRALAHARQGIEAEGDEAAAHRAARIERKKGRVDG
jgi:tetratricopeptide (TPR) repeat protein